MAHVLIVALLLAADPAFAATLGGPAVAWTDLADQVLEEAAAFAIPAAGIGVVALGIGLVTNVSIERIAQFLVAGAILAGGAVFASDILGAELLR